MSDENVGGLPELLARIYNAGYAAGHHDTVEGGYVDVVFSDRSDYHREVVEELLAGEAALSAHGQPVVDEAMIVRALCAPYGDGDISDMLRGGGDEEVAIMRAALTAALTGAAP